MNLPFYDYDLEPYGLKFNNVTYGFFNEVIITE